MSGILLVPSRGWRNAARIHFKRAAVFFGEAKPLRAEAKLLPLGTATEDYANFDSRRMMRGWSLRITDMRSRCGFL
jgi:hypothetical protein